MTGPSAGGAGWWERIEDALLVVILLALLVLSITQITARNLFDAGWIWSDQLVRVLVLWVGLFGAVVASREDHHLRVDLLPRMLGPRGRRVLAVLTHLFTGTVCAVLAWHAARFVLDERTFGSVGIAAIPGWVLKVVIPVAFALMTVRHLGHAARAVRRGGG